MRHISSRYFLWPLLIANISFLLLNVWLRPHNNEGTQSSVLFLSHMLDLNVETLSLDDDYPIEMPVQFDSVAMTLLRDTARFQIDLKNVSQLEWNTLSYHPFVVHLGHDRRAFQVALFHEIHCVHVMEQAFLRGEYHGLNSHHIQHCENYLRQSFLCMADGSIEQGDFMRASGLSADRNMGSKVCKDWMGVSAAVMDNLKDW